MIDRLAPKRRPAERPAGYQRWRNLLFAHWALPPDIVRPLVPAALELDLWEGSCFVGIVPFRMEHVRPRWIPELASFNFLETNVRTYVTYEDQPGVYFFSLDANSLPAVTAARLAWGLPYFYARMHFQQHASTVDYSVQRHFSEARLKMRYAIDRPLSTPGPGSLEFFLVERYLLFVSRAGTIFTGQVHHPSYPLEGAVVEECVESLFTAAGLPTASGPPLYAHYSPGVDVEVFALRQGGARL